jgi:cytochrome c biogenesis protein CcmG, thiol:disulfide interchange protein DsbE
MTTTEPLDQPQPAGDGPERPPAPPRRRGPHPLVVGTAAAVVSVLAGAGAALVYTAVADDDGGGSGGAAGGEAEVELRFTPEMDESGEGLVTGVALPSERFPDLDGTVRSFDDYRGTPLVVNFWASTCAPCIREMPDLERVAQETAGEVAFLGLAVRDQVDAAADMVERTGVTYDIGRDPSGAILTGIGGVALPSTLFVNAEGEVAAIETGALSLEQIRERVEALRG